MSSIFMGRPQGAPSGGGGAIQEFSTVDELVAEHASTPLDDGAVWQVANPEIMGSVIEGALSPDPITTPIRMTRSVQYGRRLIRGFSFTAPSRTIPRTIEVV